MQTPFEALAERYGIQTQYHCLDGNLCVAKPEAILSILRALGCPIDSIEDADAALHHFNDEKNKRIIEPVLVAWDGYLPKLKLPKSAIVSPLPSPLPLGYHSLTVDVDGQQHQSLIISAPTNAFTDPSHTWGTFLPLYALKSQTNWGAGDFSNLRQLVEWTARMGGGVTGTLPLLPTKWEVEHVPSPYSPWSRLFWNPFYIDCDAIPELKESRAAQKLLASSEFQASLSAAHFTTHVDYHTIMGLKQRVLKLLSQHFFKSETPRRTEFNQYVSSHPELPAYAEHMVKNEEASGIGVGWFARLLGERKSRLLYHQYVQWIADTQLATCNEVAHANHVRLYLDFPIGANPDGYDAWRYRSQFVPDIRIGAPPDPFFQGGQDWGFQPLHPQRLREAGYDYFIKCIRHHMTYAGVLRLDHVMGFHRQFWIPKGFTAQDGVYVTYPADEFYAILCLESVRHQTIIVGEDLGTVPTEVRTAMQTHGFLRTHILQFDPAFEFSTSIPAHCMTALNTHDMHPFAAFWGARAEPAAALGRYLECIAKSAAELCMVNLEDLWLETEPQNRPGTIDGNWHQKTRHPFEEFSVAPQVTDLLHRVDLLRHKGKQGM